MTAAAFWFPLEMPKRSALKLPDLLTNDIRRNAMRKRAYAASRSMTWAETAKRYLAVFRDRASTSRPEISLSIAPIVSRGQGAAIIPKMQIGHFLSLCDSTGMLQHAVHSVPDRAHGYCVDDNARALLFANSLANSGEAQLSRCHHCALCGIHPARMESGYASVSEFHELRPPMVGRRRARKTAMAGRFGLRRMCSQGH